VHDPNRPDVFDLLHLADVEVVGADLDVAEPELGALRALLSDEERRVADRYRSARDRDHSIVARGRLRQLLGARLGIDPAAVALEVSAHGKPALGPAHGRSDLAFNLSHSGSLAVYAFTSRRAVGIDIEALRDIPDAARLAKRFFSAAENEAFGAVGTDMRNLTFLACWTRKEAFVKAIGEGLTHPLSSFDVTIAPDGPARLTRVGSEIDNLGWSMATFRPRAGYIGAIVYSDD
jgi:4'-phosphopantetheinyl transferase